MGSSRWFASGVIQIDGHPVARREEQFFFGQTSLLAPERSTSGYARRSRLVWPKNPLPRLYSYFGDTTVDLRRVNASAKRPATDYPAPMPVKSLVTLTDPDGTTAVVAPELGGWLLRYARRTARHGLVDALQFSQAVVDRYPREMYAGNPILFPLVSNNRV